MAGKNPPKKIRKPHSGAMESCVTEDMASTNEPANAPEGGKKQQKSAWKGAVSNPNNLAMLNSALQQTMANTEPGKMPSKTPS